MDTYLTPAQVAERFQLEGGGDAVVKLTRKHGWPHVRLSPKRIRFTEADVAAIVAANRAGAVDLNEWRLTPRSRRRAAS